MLALIDCRADTSVLSALNKRGFESVRMPAADYLHSAVASHTDMLIFIGFGRLFCHIRYYDKNKALIDRLAASGDLALTLSDEPTDKDYPRDVLFNACIVGKRLICNKKTVSKHILNAAQDNNYTVINVSQGYTKCSVCVVSDNAIITSDRSIAKACATAGIDVLSVSEGNVSLPPFDHGFIGGASGLYSDKVFFCGSIEGHPDADAITDFCRSNGKKVVSLTEAPLFDVGTIFFI